MKTCVTFALIPATAPCVALSPAIPGGRPSFSANAPGFALSPRRRFPTPLYLLPPWSRASMQSSHREQGLKSLSCGRCGGNRKRSSGPFPRRTGADGSSVPGREVGVRAGASSKVQRLLGELNGVSSRIRWPNHQGTSQFIMPSLFFSIPPYPKET